MKVIDLNREELTELKQRFYCEKNNNASYEEINNIDEIVSDEEIYMEYEFVEFIEEDFFCNLDKERNEDFLI